MLNLFQQRQQGTPERLVQVENIKTWARSSIALADDTSLSVTELQCSEPDCPPLETVIVVLSGPLKGKQFKIHQPLLVITEAEVRALTSSSCNTCSNESTTGDNP
jgi:hypothetical protein